MSTTVEQGRPIRRDNVWVRRSGDENAVYDPQTGTVHLLNETAQAIWELCDGQTEPEEMIRAICDFFGMHPDVVVEDVERILTEFARADIIRWVR